jgi:hypothetical protein
VETLRQARSSELVIPVVKSGETAGRPKNLLGSRRFFYPEGGLRSRVKHQEFWGEESRGRIDGYLQYFDLSRLRSWELLATCLVDWRAA